MLKFIYNIWINQINRSKINNVKKLYQLKYFLLNNIFIMLLRVYLQDCFKDIELKKN